MDVLNLKGVPALVCEDNTAAQPHLDARRLKVDDSGTQTEIVLFGCNGGTYAVAGVEDVAKVVYKHGLANSLYAYSLVFVVRHGLYLPNDGSNRTLGAGVLRKWWARMLSAMQARGIPLLGTVSDGAPTMR